MKKELKFLMIGIIIALCLPALHKAKGLALSKEYILSSFRTSVEDQENNVKKNIFLACKNLDGHIIPPGGVFSFNEIVGEGSSANGFVSGRVMYRDSIIYEPGGGLCQVSSTVFNAFLLAGFSIVERHRHFQPVTYVSNGLDATIKYGKKDLKMKNPYKINVRINAVMNEKSLIITLRGDKPLEFRYEVYTDEEELNLPLLNESGERIRNGITVYVYRKKFSGKKLIENFLLYKDFYPPVKYK